MRQKLGQHFLKSERKLKAIISALDLNNGDFVVEIGPGHGELTRHLLKSGVNVVAIEKDEELFKKLAEKFDEHIKSRKLKIINGDALEVLSFKSFYEDFSCKYKIVGNIPYYITGHLLRIISEIKIKPIFTVLLIQKEVAERICAKKGEMNLLAASIQIWSDVKIVADVSRRYFLPPPKVDSAVILLKTKNADDLNAIDMEKYYNFIHIIFKQPKKTIRNNLRAFGYDNSVVDDAILKTFGKNNRIRSNRISVEDVIHLMTSF